MREETHESHRVKCSILSLDFSQKLDCNDKFQYYLRKYVERFLNFHTRTDIEQTWLFFIFLRTRQRDTKYNCCKCIDSLSIFHCMKSVASNNNLWIGYNATYVSVANMKCPYQVWEKLRKASVRIDGIREEIWIPDLRIKKTANHSTEKSGNCKFNAQIRQAKGN